MNQPNRVRNVALTWENKAGRNDARNVTPALDQIHSVAPEGRGPWPAS